ncbi:hypothetical protein EniLVp02_0123 [Vibrio phage EniLVp02]
MAVQSADLQFFTSAGIADGVESCGGAISGTQLPTELNALFDAVSATEAQAGVIDYRCVYVTNQNVTPQTLFNASIFVQTNAVGDSNIQIALDPAPVGSDSSIILTDELDSDNKLSGLVFSPASDAANALPIGDMVGGGGKKAVWIRREVTAGAAASAETIVLEVRGDTDA